MSTERLPMFSKKTIRRLILPLIVEQFLAVTVGMADIMMVASVGEAAVSGISIVDTLNILLINVFTALATGGAVAASHYLGEGDEEKACLASNQLILVGALISGVITVLSLVFNRQILLGIYGNIESSVMGYARTYYYITALSFPFLAVYNGCAAICRSMGNSHISMKVSFLMNAINVVGNAVLIFVFKMEVRGAAISTLASRIVASAIMIYIVRNPKLQLHIDPRLRLGYKPEIIKEILHIGVPVAIENSLFQGGKLLVAGLISSFGTVSIAANAVTNTIASFQVIPGSAISLAMITIVGQAVGAKRLKEAKQYAMKFCGMAMFAHFLLCVPMLLFMRQIIGVYQLSMETSELAWKISMIHGISCVLIWPLSFALPNALRAAGDVKFVMLTTLISMVCCRIMMSYVLGRYMGMGLIGVWIAMVIDWGLRMVVFSSRFASNGWLKPHMKLQQTIDR